jgi:hypothetical protein
MDKTYYSIEASKSYLPILISGFALITIILVYFFPEFLIFKKQLFYMHNLIHEAGHAIAAKLLGADILNIEISTNQGHVDSFGNLGTLRRVIIILSGFWFTWLIMTLFLLSAAFKESNNIIYSLISLLFIFMSFYTDNMQTTVHIMMFSFVFMVIVIVLKAEIQFYISTFLAFFLIFEIFSHDLPYIWSNKTTAS